jgi:hypothetical protein
MTQNHFASCISKASSSAAAQLKIVAVPAGDLGRRFSCHPQEFQERRVVRWRQPYRPNLLPHCGEIDTDAGYSCSRRQIQQLRKLIPTPQMRPACIHIGQLYDIHSRSLRFFTKALFKPMAVLTNLGVDIIPTWRSRMVSLTNEHTTPKKAVR